MAKVSIIVPIYNAEKYVCQCIDSIVTQSFSDWELLIVDDGSTDCSLSICQKYTNSDSRVKLFHKINGGVSSARNYCLPKATGEWIAFVDADDWIEQDYLAHLLQCGNADMIIGGYKNDKNVYFPISLNNQTLCIRDINFSERKSNQIFYFPWRRLYKRRIIIENGIIFDENMRLSEDTCFTIRYLAYCNSISFSSMCNYIYRTSSGCTKYKLNYEEFNIHCDKIKEAILFFFITTGIKLNSIEHNILSNFFY